MIGRVTIAKSRGLWCLAAGACLVAGAWLAVASSTDAQARAQAAAAPARRASAETKAEYDRKMKLVGAEYADGVGVIYPLLSGTNGSAVRRTTIKHLQKGMAYLSAAIADLKKIEPPTRVAKLHARLITEVKQLRGELSQATTALQHNDLPAFERVQDFGAEAKVNTTIDFIHSDGYSFLGKSTVPAPCADC